MTDAIYIIKWYEYSLRIYITNYLGKEYIMGSIFITTGKLMEEIERIKKHATENPNTLEIIEKLSKGDATPGGVNQKFTMYIPLPVEERVLSVTYTHDEQPPCMCKHLSASVNKKGELPTPEMMQLIMSLFGFNTPYYVIVKLGLKWNEKFGKETCKAINVIEPVSGNLKDLLKK
jgi:hypothetical protein